VANMYSIYRRELSLSCVVDTLRLINNGEFHGFSLPIIYFY
jgi:hypothetical protein